MSAVIDSRRWCDYHQVESLMIEVVRVRLAMRLTKKSRVDERESCRVESIESETRGNRQPATISM